MDAFTFSERERMLLLEVFKKFRAAYGEEVDEDYSNRDFLEKKLQFGGWLDELDMHLLSISVASESPAIYGFFRHWLER